MDAQELLTAMRSTYNSFDTIEEGSACVFAKITSPKGEAICLRMDRDYIEVYQKALKERSQPLLFGNLQFVLKVLDRMNSGVI